MKKYKWLIAGIFALIIITGVVLNVSARSVRSMMSDDCVEDGSCCEDENSCSCS